MIGGGSLPGEGVPTWCAALSFGGHLDEATAKLRAGSPAVVARIENHQLLLDPRTVPPEDDKAVIKALQELVLTTR